MLSPIFSPAVRQIVLLSGEAERVCMSVFSNSRTRQDWVEFCRIWTRLSCLKWAVLRYFQRIFHSRPRISSNTYTGVVGRFMNYSEWCAVRHMFQKYYGKIVKDCLSLCSLFTIRESSYWDRSMGSLCIYSTRRLYDNINFAFKSFSTQVFLLVF